MRNYPEVNQLLYDISSDELVVANPEPCWGQRRLTTKDYHWLLEWVHEMEADLAAQPHPHLTPWLISCVGFSDIWGSVLTSHDWPEVGSAIHPAASPHRSHAQVP